ncbi:HAD-IC family P-type ATPase [Streptomyces scopuliridis]
MTTELGRIAALSESVKQEPSPLERQVRRVAWLIAVVSVALAAAFIPLASFGAHLSVVNALIFAAGLLAGMVPEGLLPVITLALAMAVRALAARGALVKRLSAVETLGSTDVICTDKTGTLTENRMSPMTWTTSGLTHLDNRKAAGSSSDGPTLRAAARIAAACNNARLRPGEETIGDPTEVAVLLAAQALGADPDAGLREARRRWQFHFDPELKLMSTIDQHGDELVVHTKGPPRRSCRDVRHCWTRTAAK